MDNEQNREPRFIGVLYRELLRGKEIFSFEYNSQWLKSKYARLLDPYLMNFTGNQYLSDNKINFGMFLDSAPDSWGRLLMRRREALNARLEKRNEKTLTKTDYLLGVYDETRMGALRFKTSKNDLKEIGA